MRAFLRVAWMPALITAVVIGWLWLDRVFAWRGPYHPWLGTVILLIGVAMVAWCFGLFARIGRGSPLPFAYKTKRLVIRGPYRVVRNPMMWGVGAELIGIALILGSLGLWFGIACFVVYIALFVPLYEERDMEKRFGEEYREYCRQVPRWFPRLRRAKGKAKAAA